MRPLTLLLLSCFILQKISAQDAPRLLVTGKVISSADSSAIEGVIVSTKNPPRVTHTNKDGRYALLPDAKSGTVIEFKMYGYVTAYRTITAQMLGRLSGDTLHLDVIMQQSSLSLGTVTISSKPDTVIGNWHFFIEDYLFCGDNNFILLTFENSLKHAKVMLADGQQNILSSATVPCEATGLYRDYQGNINVMCKDSAFRIETDSAGKISVLALPYGDFCARMLPCVDTVSNGKILFSNYYRDYPAFTWYAFNPADTSVKRIHHVVDSPLLSLYNWEFDYLKPKDRLYARKMALYTGIDERIIAATMTGFPNSIYYTPLYAPLFVVHDTICVFDHYSDSLFLFDKNANPIGASKINYHHPKNWKEWDHQLHQDEVTGEIYARMNVNGIFVLQKIDIRTGKITGSYKLQNQYVKHVRIRDGFVYYIYRPFDSVQKKYLYREKIGIER